MKNEIKLIVGLSNPGYKYKNTRHNLGSIFLEKISERYNTTFLKKKLD